METDELRFDAKGVRNHFQQQRDEFIRQKTLRTVGEWLSKPGLGKTSLYRVPTAKDIETLKAGRMP